MENHKNNQRVPSRVLGGLLSALSAGVVPRVGASYIAIGRTEEIAALRDDFDKVKDGGGAVRFLIGRYGSGKSFLIQLMRSYALDANFVAADCDLSPERKLCGTGGEGIATYRELTRNLAVKSSPSGGALPAVISRWFSLTAATLGGRGLAADTEEYEKAFSEEIFSIVRRLEGYVGGFDFAYVINEYYRAMTSGDDAKQSACLRWLRGEYSNKTEARAALGSRSLSIIDDDNWFGYVKLLCAFVRMIGYCGLVVFIDECVNLYKIVNRVSRESNYEKLLSIFNDIQSGSTEGLEFVFGGTPQFLEDTRRGLFSYEALRSRLADGRFSDSSEVRILTSPVIRLRRLSDGELLALLIRLTSLHGEFYKYEPNITELQCVDFLNSELSRAGAGELITPREITRDYLNLLDVLRLTPESSFEAILLSNRTAAKEQPQQQPHGESEEKVRSVSIDDIEL